jgi:hypothetical protein
MVSKVVTEGSNGGGMEVRGGGSRGKGGGMGWNEGSDGEWRKFGMGLGKGMIGER